MKKIQKNIILFFVITFCFIIQIMSVSAKTYPPCDISQYGSINVEAGGSSTQPKDQVQTVECNPNDPTQTPGVNCGYTVTMHNSYMYGEMSLDDAAKKSKKEFKPLTAWWQTGTATITYKIDAGPGGNVTEFTYSLYHSQDGDNKVCQSQLSSNSNPSLPKSEVVIVTFKINKGHLLKINASAKQNIGDPKLVGNCGSEGCSVTVKKALAPGEKMPVNTTKKNETTTTTADPGCINNYGQACNEAEKSSSMASANATGQAGLVQGTTPDDSYVKCSEVSKNGSTSMQCEYVGKSDVNCTTISDLINAYWKYVIILVPVGLILLITVDFTKAIISNNDDQLKKSANAALKRTIATVVLLMLPILLSTILGWFGLELCL